LATCDVFFAVHLVRPLLLVAVLAERVFCVCVYEIEDLVCVGGCE
jgi:hypothetical protein